VSLIHPSNSATHRRLIAANSHVNSIKAGLHYLRSTVYTVEKNAAAAERELIRSIETDDGYLPSYTGYAALLMQQNRAGEAIAQYNRVLAKRPTAQVYTLLGILEDSSGRSTEAEASYRKALELDPDAAIAANNLAWLLCEKQGNLDEALRLATSAVSSNPTTAGFYDTLGWVYFKKGLSSPAVEQLKRAVALEEANARRTGSTPNPGYRVRLGMALSKSGDHSAAKREADISLRFASSLSQRELNEARSMAAGS
jgi:tetratricopeptide (TPR) repeat protein